MHIEAHKWYSPNLRREMELKIYGRYGESFIVFPTSKGRYFDYEDRGMIREISSFINSGKVRMFSIDGIDKDSWYDFTISIKGRNARHEAFDRYVTEEVLPFIRCCSRFPKERPMLTGLSMGAYHAMNCFLRHPELYGGVIALSGLYRLDRDEFRIGTKDIRRVYYNSPIHYLPNKTDPTVLDWLSESKIVVCCGQGDGEKEATEDIKEIEASFNRIGVKACIDLWGEDVCHDWSWWFIQMNYFLSRFYN